MGGACGSTTKRAPGVFETIRAQPVEDVAYAAAVQAPHSVHALGRVGHAGSIMKSPFGSCDCVSFLVIASQKKGSRRDLLFRAFVSVEFRIVGSSAEIFVPRAKWDFFLTHMHTAENVRMDTDRNCLICDGAKSWGTSAPLDLPKATEFWEKFNGGACPLEVLAALKGGRCDVEEFALKVGDPVAIVGKVKKVNGRLELEPGANGLAAISNRPEAAPLAALSAPPADFLGTHPAVVQYPQDSE